MKRWTYEVYREDDSRCVFPAETLREARKMKRELYHPPFRYGIRRMSAKTGEKIKTIEFAS